MSKIKDIFTSKVRIIVGLVLLVSMIAFTQVSQSGATCKGLIVILNNTTENYFLDEQDIIGIVTLHGDLVVENMPVEAIALKKMESRLRENPYIGKSEIFKDLEGNLVIDVELRRPIARILRGRSPEAYVTPTGNIMPTSEKFVSRVMLVSGQTDSLISHTFYGTDDGKNVLKMLNYISEDDFLRAQIAEMELKRNNKAILFPQITKQKIEFGILEDLDVKFRKLKVFYKEVLPRKGWNSYTRVNLEFEDQIIAE